MSEIEYFYSAHSAFAYLGSARLSEIAGASGHAIVHKPMDLLRVMAESGAGLTRDRSDRHRAYYFGREIERWAQWRSAPVVSGLPTNHREDMTLCNCVLIAALEQGHNIDRFAHRMLEGHWRDNDDLTDRDTLARLANEVELDPSPLFEAAESSAIKEIYVANTEEAISRSVFGSPTYFVDGDMFYGQDRLEHVERALQTPFRNGWSGS